MKKFIPFLIFVFLTTSTFAQTTNLSPTQTLKINQALWGVDLENSVKAISVAYDAKTDTIISFGMKSRYLVFTKPEADHPFKALKLNIEGESQLGLMLVDSARRNLFWINKSSEEIRVVNLDTVTISAEKAGEKTPGAKDQYPVKDISLDPETGWIWVVNAAANRLMGYSPDLKQTAALQGVPNPSSAAYNATQQRLLVINSLPATAGQRTATLYSCPLNTKQCTQLMDGNALYGSNQPPKKIFVTKTGSFLTLGRMATLFDPNLAMKWSLPLKDTVSAVVESGNTLGFLMRDAGHKTGESYSLLTLADETTGQELATLNLRFESQFAVADPDHNRIFVGNGGDGSVSVIDVNQKLVTKTIDVANAAEGLVVDTKTGTRYILSRLGGSEIYAWPLGSETVTRMDGGKWPSELAIDTNRRTLIALSHYESALYLWNLDNPVTRESFSLNVPHNTGDSLGDLTYDADTGTAAVIFPESGNVIVADVPNKKILWTTNFADLAVGRNSGPGGAEIAVDGTKQVVYIYDSKSSSVRVFNYSSGSLLANISLGGQQMGPPQQRQKTNQNQLPPKKQGLKGQKGQKGQRPPLAKGNKPQQGKPGLQNKPEKLAGKSDYAINSSFLDKKNNLLFAGPFVIDTNTLTLKATLMGVDKIFYADSKMILGMKENKQTKQEELVVFNPTTLTESKRFSVVEAHPIKSEQTYDPTTGRLYLSNLQPATVMVFDLKGAI